MGDAEPGTFSREPQASAERRDAETRRRGDAEKEDTERGDAETRREHNDRRITPEGAAIFSWALQKVVQINCGSLYRRNWRHGSVAWRVQYLMNLSACGGTHEEIDRLVRRIKLGIVAAALAAAAVWTVEIVAALKGAT
jgi:hypothetical protein